MITGSRRPIFLLTTASLLVILICGTSLTAVLQRNLDAIFSRDLECFMHSIGMFLLGMTISLPLVGATLAVSTGLLVAMPNPANSAQLSKEELAKKELANRIDHIVGVAGALPVEYRSDILLSLVANGVVAEPKRIREMLESVFMLAPGAKHQYRRRSVGYYNDTLAGKVEAAGKLELDALSIQCRAVTLMAKVSPRTALEMFRKIPSPSLPRCKCSEPYTYDVSVFYRTMVLMYNTGFVQAERARGEDWNFVRGYYENLTSVDHMTPAAAALQKLKLSNSQLRDLVGSYSRQLQSLHDSDRQFSFVERGSGLGQELHKLLQQDGSDNKVWTRTLLTAYQKFLLTHLTDSRCRDSGASTQRSMQQRDPAVEPTDGDALVAYFNNMLAPFVPDLAVRIPDDWKRSSDSATVLESASIEPLNIPTFNGLLHQLILRRNNKESELRDRAWESEVSGLLDTLERPELISPCPACRFHERAAVYVTLIDVLTGSIQERAVASFISLLSRDAMQYEDPAQWLSQVKLLLQFTRKLHSDDDKIITELQAKGKVLTMLPLPNGQAVLHSLQRGGNNILAAYASFEVYFPRPFESPYRLQ